jgi:DNA repair protein RadC
MSNSKLNINDWAEEDRPRERLERLGAEWLSNAELLAILIGSGNAHQTAVDLMKQVLGDCNNNLNTLGKLSIKDLERYNGIGPAKAITILAACQREGRGAERPGISDGHLQFYAPTNAGP